MTAPEEELRIELGPAADALAVAGRRLVELLRAVPDPSAPVEGLRWTLGELTTHLAARTELFAGYLAGTAEPEGAISDIAAHSERQIRDLSDVPYDTHVELIAASLAAFVETTKGRLGTTRIPGTGAHLRALGRHALAEILVHGYDVARSIGQRWRISAEDARTIIRASLVLAPHYVDPQTTRGTQVAYRLLVRGGPRVRVRIDDGSASIEDADGSADCTIRAEPRTFVLLSFGRMSRWRAAVRGRLLATGRRPWRALAFSRSFLPP
jgi:uncharacterized protein (TIGR03083 family)